MKAKEIIKLMCCDAEIAEQCVTWEYDAPTGESNKWEMLDGMFGDTDHVIGDLEGGTMYLYRYSDAQRGYFEQMPDAIIVLRDGRCVFLYKVED